MPAAEQDGFAQFFSVLNDAAVGRIEWIDVLGSLQRLLGVKVASIDIVDKKTGSARLLATEPIPPDQLDIYSNHLWRLNPRYSLAPISAVGRIVGDRHIDPEIDAKGKEYYEWLDRVGGTRYFAGVKLYDTAEFTALSSIHVPASRGPVDRSTEELFAKLVPHVANALAVHQALAERGDTFSGCCKNLINTSRAYALLRGDGRILDSSETFRTIIARSGILSLTKQRLGALRGADQARLARLIGAAINSTDPAEQLRPIRLQPPRARHGLLLRAVRLDRARELFERLRPVAMLVLIDLDAPTAGVAEDLRLAWGLTPREADLAILIGEGCALERAAARLGMGEGTARWHLKTIFRKMGIERQTELAHLVTRLGS